MVTGFLAGATLVFAFAGFTPLVFEVEANFFFMRAALFLWITPFLTALSMLLWALLWAVDDGLILKAFRALFRVLFVFELRIAALFATRTRFLADLMIGI